jgi:CRP-like cAMP-binding protein
MEKFRKSIFRPMSEFAMIKLGIKSKQATNLKIRIFTRTSMPRLLQNDREGAMGMVQAEMTHQAVADHFNVSRITIARQMMRLRQTGRTNNRPVTAGRV